MHSIHIYGGGTIMPVRSHLALCAPAFGGTARQLAEICKIEPNKEICVGQRVTSGALLGWVIPVLAKDKGRPRCMLHLELHHHGSRSAPEWLINESKPSVLRDPTPYLLDCIKL